MQRLAQNRLSHPLRRTVGPALAVLAIVAGGLRQVLSNRTVPAPFNDGEATLAVNAYAPLRSADLSIPTSVSDSFTSTVIASYASLTSATSRHDFLVGTTREFALVVCVLTAALVAGVCRRLHLSWLSTAVAVALTGIPGAIALVRIVSASAALAALFLAAAALAAVIAAERRRPLHRWLLGAVSLAAAVLAVLTAGISVLLLLGLALGLVSTRRLHGRWTLTARGLAILGIATALAAAAWLTVWQPSLQDVDSLSVTGAGAVVGLGGLLVAAACAPIPWLRPLALGAVPMLIAAAWPGPVQADALIVAITLVALLTGGLLDHLLHELRSSAPARLAAAGLLVAVTVGAVLLPGPATAASTTSSAIVTGEVATWIRTQLEPDAVIEVDPINRARLVRAGLDPARLTITDGTRGRADLVLAPLDAEADLPLVARFGNGGTALGLRQIVPDTAAFTEALATEQAARSRFGTALTSNVNLRLASSAGAALAAGTVDARLMACLATASSATRFAIAEFTGSTGDLAEGSVLREVTLTDVTDLDPTVGASGTSTAALRWLAQFFEMQQPPYQPLTVIQNDESLTVRYSAPSPLGLLP